jgi:AraC-like DNA-binding protein/ligand-binding sensor protein
MQKKNIIQRRDLEPLWAKATKVVQHYEKASNCISAVIGADYVTAEYSKNPKALLFCTLCKRYYRFAWKLPFHQHPCSAMHLGAIQEGRKLGGSYVYTCPLGFFFWTSPFFSGERFAGALTSSGALAVDKQLVMDRLLNVCKREISRAEVAHFLDDIPERSVEEVKALAQMMMLCTEKISCRESYWDDLMEPNDKQSCQSNNMDLERLLVASLRRGDRAESQNLMRKLLNGSNITGNHDLGRFKLKAIELIVMLSRSGANSENNEELIDANNRYLKRIEDSETIEDVTRSMNLILDGLAGEIFSFQGVRHASVLRKAERYIWENYTRKINLKEVADVSGLSAPYFSTIFKDEMGENFSNYLNRLRVEKASLMLRETESTIGGISTACGFEDKSWFSKTFKSYIGFSPSKYRKQGGAIMAGQNQEIKKSELTN